MHPSHRQLHITPIETPLYVVTAIDNPEQFATRFRHYRSYEKHIEDSGAILYTVEVAIGNRHFECTEAGNPRHIQLRAKSVLWRKENLQNIGVAHLPHDWQHVALGDADMINTRPDWVQATVQALQRYDAVQLFSTYSFLGSDYKVHSTNEGFVYAMDRHTKERQSKPPGAADYGFYGAPGGEWAYRRSAWDTLEGLLQTPILGSADRSMTHALAGQADEPDKELVNCAPNYVRSIEEWQERAKLLKGNIWYIQNHAIHYWHGPYSSRGYEWRGKILATNAFNQDTDLKTELSGLLELRGNKPAMRNEIDAYFRSRNEDSI